LLHLVTLSQLQLDLNAATQQALAVQRAVSSARAGPIDSEDAPKDPRTRL